MRPVLAIVGYGAVFAAVVTVVSLNHLRLREPQPAARSAVEGMIAAAKPDNEIRRIVSFTVRH
jgi:hypothetical protein